MPEQHAGLYLIQLGYKIFVYSVKLRKSFSWIYEPTHMQTSRVQVRQYRLDTM